MASFLIFLSVIHFFAFGFVCGLMLGSAKSADGNA